jgi:hypothetical protein
MGKEDYKSIMETIANALKVNTSLQVLKILRQQYNFVRLPMFSFFSFSSYPDTSFSFVPVNPPFSFVPVNPPFTPPREYPSGCQPGVWRDVLKENYSLQALYLKGKLDLSNMIDLVLFILLFSN